MSATYIKWNDPGVETIQSGEEEKMKQISQIFDRFQMLNFQEHGHCFRGTHLKTQGCVRGTLTIHPNLPAHLAQGMFSPSSSTPRVHDVIMRYSSLPPKILSDNIPTSRGVGLKVFDVLGEKLWPGNNQNTQDFTFNNSPILEFREAKSTYEIFDCLERNWNDLEKFGQELERRDDAEIATVGTRLERLQMVAMTQYSQSAYRYGSYIAKFALFPLGEAQLDLRDPKSHIPLSAPPNTIAQHLRAFHRAHTVRYVFCVQLLQNLAEQSVEDIGVQWDPVKYPFEPVATLEFPPQDSGIEEVWKWWDESGVSCNPWHGLVVHRPLGSTNRVRRAVYKGSREMRSKLNGMKHFVEPASLREVPGYGDD